MTPDLTVVKVEHSNEQDEFPLFVDSSGGGMTMHTQGGAHAGGAHAGHSGVQGGSGNISDGEGDEDWSQEDLEKFQTGVASSMADDPKGW